MPSGTSKPFAFTIVLLILCSFGCRAHPVSLALMVVGDGINDADVQQRADDLLGHNIAAADSMFGARQETLEDTRGRGRMMIVYPVKGDLLGTSRYVLEVSNGAAVALTKTIQDIDGMEDVIREASLRQALLGKGPAACQGSGNLGRPVLVLRDVADDTLVRVYDVRNQTHLRGARYCVLRFDADDKCEKVNLVGVSASTKPDSARP